MKGVSTKVGDPVSCVSCADSVNCVYLHASHGGLSSAGAREWYARNRVRDATPEPVNGLPDEAWGKLG